MEGKVCWDLYIDGLVISSDGNLLDALAAAIKVFYLLGIVFFSWFGCDLGLIIKLTTSIEKQFYNLLEEMGSESFMLNLSLSSLVTLSNTVKICLIINS